MRNRWGRLDTGGRDGTVALTSVLWLDPTQIGRIVRTGSRPLQWSAGAGKDRMGRAKVGRDVASGHRVALRISTVHL